MSIKIFRQFQLLNKFVNNTCRASTQYSKGKRNASSKHKKLDDEMLLPISEKLLGKKINYRSKQNGEIYVTGAAEAESIASHVCNEWKNGYILEANPGPGVLSKAILNFDIFHLRVFEKREEFLPLLKDLSGTYPNLEIIPEDLTLLPSLERRLPANEQTILDSFFTDIQENEWDGEISFRLFCIVCSKRSVKFLRYVLAVLPSKASLFSLGRCELFLLLSDAEYAYMNAEPKENFATYRWVTVLYSLFFKIEYLQKYSSGIFHTSPSLGKKNQHFHLVKLTPRADLFSFIVNGNKLSDFYFFVRHHLIKRTGLVIPTMEGWIPSCGPRLIKEGMHVFTKFGDLSPDQILMLFNQFSSWPEYEDSSFSAALQRWAGKYHVMFEEENNV